MNQLGSGDRGTVLESLDGVRLQLAGGTLAEPVRPEAPPAGPGFEEELYRPRIRPGVPRLVMLDDGVSAPRGNHGDWPQRGAGATSA